MASTAFFESNSLYRNDCENLASQYTFNGKLGQGKYASVYQMCKKGRKECDYALKVMYDSDNSSNSEELWKKEVRIHKTLNDYQNTLNYKFVPCFYDAWKCMKENINIYYLLTEKYYGDLDDFVNTYCFENDGFKVAIIAKLELLEVQLRLIHEKCHICLNDIHLGNILYKQEGRFIFSFVFTDFGRAEENSTDDCEINDSMDFQRTIRDFSRYLNSIEI